MRLIALIALIIGAAIGLFLPDTDRVFPFLLHRSIVTHSALVPLLGYLSCRKTAAEWKRAGVIGLSLTLAVHLSFDLFPRLWIGFALIQIPFTRPLNATLSMAWLMINLIVCLYLALRLLGNRTELAIAGGLGLLSFLIAARSETVFWSALLALLVAALLATCLPNSHVNGQTLIQYYWQRLTRRSTP